VQRLCKGCQEDISHRRKDAKVCGSTCYGRANRVVRRIQNNQAAAKRYKINRQNLLDFLKNSNGCVDCQELDPIVLEFDHVSNKRAQIADILGSWNWKTIEFEISKCEIRCANCHRRKTAKQFGWYKGSDANDRE
jgi:hypothetical protein